MLGKGLSIHSAPQRLDDRDGSVSQVRDLALPNRVVREFFLNKRKALDSGKGTATSRRR